MNGKRAEQRRKACDTCRRKKTRCDGERPVCASCRAFHLPCNFQDHTNSRRSNKEYVRELEDKVRSMEAILQSRTPSVDELTVSEGNRVNADAPNVDLEQITIGEVGQSTRDHYQPIDQTSAIDEGQVPYVMNAPNGSMRFFGPSSGFSAISSRGDSYSGYPMESKKRLEFDNSASRWQITPWIPQILQDEPAHRVFQSLPNKQTTTNLVRQLLTGFNMALPLFEEQSLMKLVENHFSWNPDERPSWWAALNVALAIAYRDQAQQLPDGSEYWKLSFGHIKNALNVVIQLFMRAADLLAVQGMLGLALYFQDTPNPQPLFMFAAAAIRLAQSIGLHRSNVSGCSPSQIEERKRTYWLAFILDADISLRTGRPPAQDANDYDTPASFGDDVGIIILNGIKMNYFRTLAQFAVIQRQLYHQLYSAAATKTSGMSKITKVLDCEKSLLEWRRSIPDKFWSEPDVFTQNHPLMSHVLRLHFAYHSCYANLHRIFLASKQHIQSLEQSVDALTTAKNLEISTARSLNSARSAIDLTEYVELFSPSFAWGVLYFPAVSTVTLFANILVNPFHVEARSDLSRIRRVVKFLTKLSSQDQGTYVDYILKHCSNFEAEAKRILDNAERDAAQASVIPEVSGLQDHPMAHIQGPAQPNILETSLNMSDPYDLSAFDLPDASYQFSTWSWQDMASGMPPSF